MIRKMQNTDINRVADIWLKTNLKAHDFIPDVNVNFSVTVSVLSPSE